AYTKRDRVVACGYHGWQDWYIGATARNLGVPQATRGLTSLFNYNDLDSLKRQFELYPDQIAAVIMEPMNVYAPEPGFLEGVKEITRQGGAVLIFDETVTGFRFSIGGAQKMFGVTPDLATFGKGMANGYPISVLCGRADIMTLMEEIFFSTTFGGETLSLAAAQATITKLKVEPVIETLRNQGTKVMVGLRELIRSNDLENTLSVAGDPSWSFFMMKDSPGVSSWELKTLYMQEMMARSILTLGTFNMSYAHSDADIAKLLSSLGEVLPIMGDAIRSGSVSKFLNCEPLKPLFRVR
ncbi:MAG: aminotransferase class III-fold pyridoxal phosphate-dependent enzyme, partial [Proteobacteria bacterium]